ncbi:MAG: VanZ family protein [Bacteroidales bacterium]
MDKKSKRGFLLTALFALFILILTVIPTGISEEAPGFFFKGMDKLIHGIMYGLLAMLSLYEYFKLKPLSYLPYFLILLGVFLYSILMEIIQHYLVAYRSCEMNDVLANLFGILIAALFILWIKKVKS